MVQDVSEAQAIEMVENEKEPVLIDFWAPWCGHCVGMAPVFEAASEDLAGKVKCVKINSDESPALAQRYEILVLPTMVMTKNGQEIERIVGSVGKAKILEKVQHHLA